MDDPTTSSEPASDPAPEPAQPATPMKRKRRKRTWKFRLVALAVGLLFSLLFGELGVRVLGLGVTNITRGALHKYDPEAGWICTPNLDSRYQKPGSFDVRIRCNSRGLRDTEEHPFEKPAGERRIVFLGDSATWGWGLEDDQTVAARVEQGLPNTQTLNLGANGYSTVQSLVRLETEGLRYSPDVVVHAFVHNDLEDNFDEKDGGRPVVSMTPEGEATILNRPVRRQWKPAYKQWLRHHSRLFGLLEFTTERWKVYWSRRQAVQQRADEQAVAKAYWSKIDQLRAKGELIVNSLDMFGTPGEVTELAWGAERALLKRMKALCDGAGAQMVVLLVTGRAEVSQKAFRAGIVRYGLDPDDPKLGLDIDRPRTRLASICRELGIVYVDPTERFREAEDEETLFLPHDGHWSPKGAKLAADTLLGALKKSS